MARYNEVKQMTPYDDLIQTLPQREVYDLNVTQAEANYEWKRVIQELFQPDPYNFHAILSHPSPRYQVYRYVQSMISSIEDSTIDRFTDGEPLVFNEQTNSELSRIRNRAVASGAIFALFSFYCELIVTVCLQRLTLFA